ncbi:Glutathione reductase, chloroplastic [Glycine soja]|nr:Glutathione reductase, chloroplastic [Glycine soja]
MPSPHTTTSTSSPSAQTATGSEPLAWPPTMALLSPSASFLSPLSPLKPLEVSMERELASLPTTALPSPSASFLSPLSPPKPPEASAELKQCFVFLKTGSVGFRLTKLFQQATVLDICVIRGCVPKKLLVYASKFSHEFEESNGFGWRYDSEPKHDWSSLIANKNAELQRLTGIYKNILNNAGVKLIEGHGKIIDPHTVDVNGKLYSAKHILVTVGGRPFIPDIPGKEYAIDSDAALDLPTKPEKIAIVGGGYIALEFAGIFNGLKSEVHVFIRQKKVLRGFDEEIRDFVSEQMSVRGIEFHTEESPQAITKSADGSFSLKTNKGTVDGFSHIMFATGRRPNTQNLGLESVGVKIAKDGAIEVDEYSQTSVPSIWAVGDVTNRINLTPVALMEGGALVKTLFQDNPTKPDYRAVPSAVFSQPPIGQVGLTEEQAVQQYGDIDIFTANFRPLKATLSGLPDRVFMKLVVCAKTNEVLGLHMCGDDAPEIVQGFAVALKARLTKADFDATVGIHPSAAEEFVTMRTPTRKIRKSESSEVFNCPQLREISLEFSCLENDSTDLKTMIEGLGRSCPRLQNIHIASIRLSHSAVLALTAAQLRGLRMLSLVLGSEITDASVAAIASSYPNLELLDLSGSGVSDSGISMICNVFPDTLTRLLLALCPNVTSSGIQFATFQLPHLEIMDCGMTICDPNTENPTADENNCNLQKTSGVNVHLINQKLIIKHSRLKKLSLWGCTGLDALYLNCPRLIDLNLNSCSNLHPGRLLLQCPNLENVHASGCQDMLIGAIQSQVHDASAEMENHSQSKRLPDGSKRIRVPHLLSEEEFPEPEKKRRKIERQLCNVLLD